MQTTTAINLRYEERRGYIYHINRIIRSLRNDLGGVIGLFLFFSISITAIFAPSIAPYDPLQQNLRDSKLSPAFMEGGTWKHLFGTDKLGRDLFSRIVFGTRVSLLVGFFGVLIAASIGMFFGLIAGYMGGHVDNVIMGLTNLILALPYLLFVVFIASILGRSLLNVILIFGLTDAPLFIRLTRGEVLRLRESVYIHAALSLGAKMPRILFRHILLNLVGALITIATFEMSGMIFYEAGLGFLGLSVPPSVPSWGNMLSQGRDTLTTYPWIDTFPGLAIMVTSLAMNLLGDWLRDFFDPHRH